MKKVKMVDYTRLSVRALNTPEYAHLRYLIFWPLFGIAFLIIERLWIREKYYAVSCWIDSQIPFCEFFLPAYLSEVFGIFKSNYNDIFRNRECLEVVYKNECSFLW